MVSWHKNNKKETGSKDFVMVETSSSKTAGLDAPLHVIGFEIEDLST